MADLTITDFGPIFDNAQIPHRLLSAPVAANLDQATAVTWNGSTNKFEKATTETSPALFAGLLTKDALAGYVASAFRGLTSMDGLSGMSIGDLVYLSTTDGALCDANPGLDEIQTFEITGTPTGGTFTLTFGGQTTGAIAYNANAATVQAALEALSSIRAGNVVCGGGALPGAAVTVTFVNALGQQDASALTFDIALLTGGAPAASVTETQAGVTGVAMGRVVPVWKGGGTVDKAVEVFECPLVVKA